ncbi:MAG TPA: hypothetical protein VK540_06595 [Polyangiaceae bacterium]|jgi:hypothetical protein|nr:hypothetical protein [Polyangiaceae bacterium]
MKWICAHCNKPAACEFCETCADHCVAKRKNDVEAHRKVDSAIARVDPGPLPD